MNSLLVFFFGYGIYAVSVGVLGIPILLCLIVNVSSQISNIVKCACV